MRREPSIGQYEGRGDGSYRLYVGEEKGWILCDDYKDLQEELSLLSKGGPIDEKGQESVED